MQSPFQVGVANRLTRHLRTTNQTRQPRVDMPRRRTVSGCLQKRRSKMEFNLRRDTGRLGPGRRPAGAGRQLPCVNDLEPEGDEQLEGQRRCAAETNKTISQPHSGFQEFLRRQIRMVALAQMAPPMMQTICLSTAPPHRKTISHATSLLRSPFLPILLKGFCSTTARKTTWRMEHLSSTNLSCSLRKTLTPLRWSIFRSSNPQETWT